MPRGRYRVRSKNTFAAQANPYLAPRLAAMQKLRTDADARDVEDYKSQLQHYSAVELKGREYQANMRRRPRPRSTRRGDDREGQGRRPAARAQDVENKVIMGDDGVYRRPVIEGADPNAMPSAKLTKRQSDSVSS